MCQRKFRPIKYMRRYSYGKFGTFILGHPGYRPIYGMFRRAIKLIIELFNCFKTLHTAPETSYHGVTPVCKMTYVACSHGLELLSDIPQ